MRISKWRILHSLQLDLSQATDSDVAVRTRKRVTFTTKNKQERFSRVVPTAECSFSVKTLLAHSWSLQLYKIKFLRCDASNMVVMIWRYILSCTFLYFTVLDTRFETHFHKNFTALLYLFYFILYIKTNIPSSYS